MKSTFIFSTQDDVGRADRQRYQRKQALFVRFGLAGLLLIVLLALLELPKAQAQSPNREVLYINSYHLGYKFSDDITLGIRELFEREGNINLRIEYLDTKRLATPEYMEQIYQLFAYKYKDANLDLIISSDDAALNFLLENADQLFPGVPVVFSGANFFDPTRLAGHAQFTGISEEADLRGTIDLALDLQPNIDQIVVVNDTTVTGQILHERLVELIAAYPQLTFELLEDVSMAEIQQRVAGLTSNSVVLLTIFAKDKNGEFFEYDQYSSLISQSSAVPVYATWDFSLGYGVLGGKMTSGYNEGQRVANLALRVLNGEDPADIPVDKRVQSRYMFDYTVMQKFDIPVSALPQDSYVLDRPVSFFEANRNTVLGISAGFVGLSVVIVILFVNNQQRRRVQRELTVSNAELQEIRASLEQRVAERTAAMEQTNLYLALATEVGQNISQVRQLDAMLRDAAEIIRAFFGLYYVQVYLTNPTETELVLEFGTGDVGKELMARRHRLPLDETSINGRAAITKRSIVIPDTSTSPIFRSNPLLPNTRSEIAVPLLVGDQLIGVLDMQSEQPNALNAESLIAFEPLSGQFAIAIQNARLIHETQEARLELETLARRLTRASWDEYLDAIHKPELTGFVYAQNRLRPLDESEALPPMEDADIIQAPIEITGEILGSLIVETTRGENATELVESVARQMVQQIENLRLLESADRYRNEAAQAIRRLTRQGWENTQAQLPLSGYLYRNYQVQPLDLESTPANARAFPIIIRDEAIGEIFVDETALLSPEDQEMLDSVRQQLAAHLENLRLAQETQTALTQTEALYAASARVVQSITINDVLEAVVENTSLRQFERASILLFNRPWVTSMPESGTLAAVWERSGHLPKVEVGAVFPLETVPTIRQARRDRPTFVRITPDMPGMNAQDFELIQQIGINSVLIPLVAGEQWIGWLSAATNDEVDLKEDDLRQISTLTGQAATVIQSILLYQQAQQRAQREQTLREVTTQLRASVDADTILRTAVRELGLALGRETFVYIGDRKPSAKPEQPDLTEQSNRSAMLLVEGDS